MDGTKSSAVARTEHPPGYTDLERRALALFEERGALIRAVASGVYEVPSSGMLGKRYTVRYGGSRASEERCSCPAWAYGDGRACKHLICLGIMHAARRSGVREIRAAAVVAGDPFKAASKQRLAPERVEDARRFYAAEYRAEIKRLTALGVAGPGEEEDA